MEVTNRLELNNISEDMEISVTFKEKENVSGDVGDNSASNVSKTSIMENVLIYVGGGTGGVIVIALIVFIFKGAMRKKGRNKRINKFK